MVQYPIKFIRISDFLGQNFEPPYLTPMRVTEKNSTDSEMGRRPVWVTRTTNSVGRIVKKLENMRFDWPKNSNMVFLIRSTVGTDIFEK